jgi:hypothetical protein
LSKRLFNGGKSRISSLDLGGIRNCLLLLTQQLSAPRPVLE